MARAAARASCLLACALVLQGSGEAVTTTWVPTEEVPAEPPFRVVEGQGCYVEGSCLASSRRGWVYGNSQGCRASVAGSALLAVRAFETERGFDELEVNGRRYSGRSGPEGVVATGEIRWSSDRIEARSGWRVCAVARTTSTASTSTALNSTVTTSTATTSTTDEAPFVAAPFRVTEGDGCEVFGSCLVSSRRRRYGNGEGCQAAVTGGVLLAVREFETEMRFDELEVNGQRYSGRSGPEGVVATGEIRWSSDGAFPLSGWRVCTAATWTATTSTSTTSTATTSTAHSNVYLKKPLHPAAALLLALSPLALVRLLGAPKRMAADVFFASADLVSQLYWVLQGGFYDERTLLAAAACLPAASLAFITVYFWRGLIERPVMWGSRAFGALECPAKIAWGPTGVLPRLVKQEGPMANAAALLALSALAAMAAALLILAAALLFAAWLAASLLWTTAALLLGALLHAARLLAVKNVLCAYRWLLGANAVAASEEPAGEVVSLPFWNRAVAFELLLGTAPGLAVNAVDAALQQEPDAAKGQQLVVSGLALALLGSRLLYYTAVKGLPLRGVPMDEPDAPAAASSAAAGLPARRGAVVAGTVVSGAELEVAVVAGTIVGMSAWQGV